MLNEWSCPFALWLNSPHIQGLLSPCLKCGLFKHRFESPMQMHTHSAIRSFSGIKIKLTQMCCVLTENTSNRRFSSIRFKLILHISFILICVKWKQTSPAQEQTHHRWTHIYCVPTKALFSETWKVGCTNTALSFFIPSLALSVGIAVTHRRKKHTRSVDVFPAHRKMSSVFKGFFFKGLCELQCAWLVKWGLSLLCQLEAVQSFKYFAH